MTATLPTAPQVPDDPRRAAPVATPGAAPSVPPPMVLRRPREGVPFTTDGLAVLALVALWAVGQLLLLSGASEHRAQTVLYRDFRAQVAAATAPMGGAVPVGDPVALLTLPRSGEELVVVEGTSSQQLQSGPGHRRDTALPGQQGVSVVYGRARTYGGPFGDLTTLKPGDVVTATTQQGTARFAVDGVRRGGDPLPQPLPAGGARLTLVSEEGGSVVYVDATSRGKAFVAAPGRPAAVGPTEQAMGTDSSSLPLLVVCLAGVMAIVGGVSLAVRRFPRVLVWLLTAPVLGALLWVTTDTAARLLPNLL